MQVETKGAADRRALTRAALFFSLAGFGLVAACLAPGLDDVAHRRSEAVHVALGPNAGFRADVALGSGVERLPVNLDESAPGVAAARPVRARELDCLARAVYFEARGESARGQQAVATVIMNRVKAPNYPKTVCGVVYQGARSGGCQFSFACDGQAERVSEPNAWDRARGVAGRVLSGAVLRDVGSATHFHTTGVAPQWGSQMLRVAQVGLHVFYRFNPHAPRPAPVEAEARAVFVSAPAPAGPPLRLAEALTAPAPAVEAAAAPAETKVAAKLPETSPAGVAKADAPAPAKPETAS